MTDERMIELLRLYLPEGTTLGQEMVSALQGYLALLERWNARTNLTAIREPEAMVQRHFGESLFAAAVLSPLLAPGSTLLDFGSGAGFPGLPIQIYRPDLQVTLAESQSKKGSFLREVVRSLGLSTAVHTGRAETLLAGTRFDCITLRAVDNMQVAIEAAVPYLAPAGCLALLTTPRQPAPGGLRLLTTHAIPGSFQGEVRLYGR